MSNDRSRPAPPCPALRCAGEETHGDTRAAICRKRRVLQIATRGAWDPSFAARSHVHAIFLTNVRRSPIGNAGSSWLELACPLCGQVVMLDDAVICSHANGEISCEGSGRRANVPHYEISTAYECRDCLRTTKSNLRTGIVYSHNLPNSTEVCSSSASYLGRIGLSVELVLLPPKRDTPAAQKPGASKPVLSRGYPGESHESVRTVSGGLPGLGKR